MWKLGKGQWCLNSCDGSSALIQTSLLLRLHFDFGFKSHYDVRLVFNTPFKMEQLIKHVCSIEQWGVFHLVLRYIVVDSQTGAQD